MGVQLVVAPLAMEGGNERQVTGLTKVLIFACFFFSITHKPNYTG